MEKLGVKQWKTGGIFTLLLFAATLACAGCVALIPTEEEAVPTVSEEVAVGEVEVFSVLPHPTSVTVFRGFVCPVTGQISSAYGYRNDPFTGETKYHKGVDVAVPEGTAVKAAFSGTVTEASFNNIGGNYIVIDHGNGISGYYGHLQVCTVSKGDKVATGDVIGKSGKTGKVTGAHLHFQLSYKGRTVNPETYLDFSHDPV